MAFVVEDGFDLTDKSKQPKTLARTYEDGYKIGVASRNMYDSQSILNFLRRSKPGNAFDRGFIAGLKPE